MSTARKPNMPSIKTLQSVFQHNAKEARTVLKMSRDELEAHPIGSERIKQCYHASATWFVRMHILNNIGGFHGVESIEGTRGEWAEYLNTGDMYASTIIYWRGRYRVQSLGDFIETQERQGKRFK